MYYDFQKIGEKLWERFNAPKEKIGEKLWERFNAPKEKIAWYYNGIVDALSVLEDYEMYQELKNTSAALFKK